MPDLDLSAVWNFATALLIGALIAWMGLLGRPQLRRLDGRVVENTANQQIAASLVLAAVGSSALAAILAIGGWIGV